MTILSLHAFRASAVRALRPSAPWVALAMALSALALACGLDVIANGRVGTDFRSFYLAALAVRAHVDMYDVEALTRLGATVKLEAPYPYLYPPFFAYVLAPLAALPAAAAQAVWSFVSVGALGTGVAAHVRTLHRAQGDGARGAELVTVAALLFWLLPVRGNLAMGQVNFVVLGVLLIGLAALTSGRDVMAGTALALAAMIKVTPAAFVLFLLARRRYRAAVAFCVALAGLALLSIALGALPAWARYRALLPALGPGQTAPGLFPPGVIFNLGFAGAFSRLFPLHATLVRVLSLAATALLLAPVLFRARRAKTEAEAQRALAPLFVVMVVSSPLVYLHHLIYLLPAVLFAIVAAIREERYGLLAGAILAAAVAGAEPSALYGRLRLPAVAMHVASSLNLYALLTLYGVCLATTRPVATGVAEEAVTSRR